MVIPMSKLLQQDDAATSLEWALILGAVAIPSYWMSQFALSLLVEHYRMIALLNSLPGP